MLILSQSIKPTKEKIYCSFLTFFFLFYYYSTAGWLAGHRVFFLFLFYITAFMCHHNTFLVYQSMRDATLERWEKVTHISIAFAWVVSALFGMAGYATFRALSQGEYFFISFLQHFLSFSISKSGKIRLFLFLFFFFYFNLIQTNLT